MNAWRDLRKLPRELWILSFATFVNRLGTMVLPFLVLYLTRSLGFSPARAGALLAAYGVSGFLIGPMAGRLSDRLGGVRTMAAALTAFGLVVLMYPFAHSWISVTMMTILLGAANESFRPANLALVGSLAPPHQRKAAFSLSRLSLNLGMSVGPALGGILAQWRFSSLFIVDGLTALTAAAIVAKWMPRDAAVEAPAAPRRQPLHALFADPALRALLLGIIPVFLVFWQVSSTLPLFLVRDLKVAESGYGMLFTLNTLMILALEVPLNAATAHWPHRRTLAAGAFLFALGFGSLALVHSYWQVALTVVVWTFGEMILFPGAAAYVSELAPAGRQGEYMGLYGMVTTFAFIIGPWLGTLTLEHYGATTLWIATFAVALISVAALNRNGRQRDRLAAAQTSTRISPSRISQE